MEKVSSDQRHGRGKESSERRPPLTKINKVKCQSLSQEILEDRFFKGFLWTDEMRMNLDGPDGWAWGWITIGDKAPLKCWAPVRWRRGMSKDYYLEE